MPGPILSMETSLAIAVVVKPSITYYNLYPMVPYGIHVLFPIILIKHLSFEKLFLFSCCGCLSGPNYLNLHWKLLFSKNLQDAKFKSILSLRPNHCGPSGDTKTSKFFSHSFSWYNSEELIRTLDCYSKFIVIETLKNSH